MRKLIKDSRKGGFLGQKARFNLKIAIGASLLLFALAAMFFISGGMAVIPGVLCATAPLAGFILPEELGLTEKEKKGLEAIAQHLKGYFDDHAKGYITGDALNDAIAEALKGLKLSDSDERYNKLKESLEAQGIALKKLEVGGKGVGQSIGDQIKAFISRDDFAKGLKEQKGQSMEVKAAEVIITSNASGAPHSLRYEVVPGVQEAPREATVFFPMLSKGNTSARTIIWINRKDKEGGSAFIAEGTLKPLKDWTYDEETSEAKKVAVATKISMEMLHDHLYIQSEIDMLLRRDLLEKIDASLLAGGGGNDLTGFTTGAAGYTGTGLDGTIPMANNADVIRALILQMRLLNFKPDIAFINPTEAAALDLLKDTNGSYIRVEVEGILRNVRIIETTEVPVGRILLVDSARLIVRMLENIRVDWGWENDDFRKNLVLVIAEARLHSYRNSIDNGSVIYEEFATVRAALNQATAPTE